MFKNIFYFLLFICKSMPIYSLPVVDAYIFSEIHERYNLSICAIFKNEALNLKEWIEYHRLFGVDHFYLYNIGSTDCFQVILDPYISEGIVTVINWPEILSEQADDNAYRWALCTQIPAYENAANFIARNETKWLVFVDINEFLVCPEGNNIRDLLEKYDEYPGISLSSEFFDAGIYDEASKRKLLIQTLSVTNPPKKIVDKSVSKMIFKPKLCAGFMWPPYQCRFKNSQSSLTVDRTELRINHYINRNFKQFPFGKTRQKLDIDHRLLSEIEVAELLEEGYSMEDREQAIFQFIPELLKKLGKNKRN